MLLIYNFPIPEDNIKNTAIESKHVKCMRVLELKQALKVILFNF